MPLVLENTYLSIYGYHLSIRGSILPTDFQMAEKKITQRQTDKANVVK